VSPLCLRLLPVINSSLREVNLAKSCAVTSVAKCVCDQSLTGEIIRTWCGEAPK
jgi:hypothetical protein